MSRRRRPFRLQVQLTPEEQSVRTEQRRLRREEQEASKATQARKALEATALYSAVSARMAAIIRRWCRAAESGDLSASYLDAEDDGMGYTVWGLAALAPDDGMIPAWDHGMTDIRLRITHDEGDTMTLSGDVFARAQVGEGWRSHDVVDDDVLYSRDIPFGDIAAAEASLDEIERIDDELVAESLREMLESVSEDARQYCQCGNSGYFERPNGSKLCRSCMSDQVHQAIEGNGPRRRSRH